MCPNMLGGVEAGPQPGITVMKGFCGRCRYRRRKQNCPNCNYSWCENLKDSDMKLRKVRGQHSSCRSVIRC